MKKLKDTVIGYQQGSLDKPSFIREMYDEHHAKLYDYAGYLEKTNIKKIEIEANRVVMTSRDRGVKIICSPGDFRIAPIETLNFRDYEKDDSSLIERLVSDGDTVFDVGANFGWYSINLALAFRNAKVLCFEPIPRTFKSLLDNIEINPVANVHPYNFGLSKEVGEFTFFYYPEGSGNASAANLTGRTDVESVVCKVRTLDDFVEETGERIDFMKCDVEGAELFVFQGGVKTIARDKPIVFSEILRKWSAKFGYNPNEIFSFFRRLGYSAYVSKNSLLEEFVEMTEETVETNFFFLHQEKHSSLIRRFS